MKRREFSLLALADAVIEKSNGTFGGALRFSPT
jgi:hypothetical protein